MRTSTSLCLAAILALGAAFPHPAGAQSAATRTSAAVDSEYAPSQREPSGIERVAVFISASFCIANRQPGFKEDVRALKRLLAANARADGRAFSVTGVALDWSVADGVRYLEEFGPFDEIAVGRNWFNSAAVQRVWADTASRPMVPQLIIIERAVTLEPTSVKVGAERVVARIEGGDQIAAWVRAGGRAPSK